MTNLEIVATVVLAMVAVGFAIWLIPRWQVDRWRRAGISNEEKLAELGVQARSGITQALGGLALIVTISITAFQVTEARRSADRTQQSAVKSLNLATRNVALAEQGQVSERFSRAVEQLGATDGKGQPATPVRTGALFSLMRIGIDSEVYTQPALLVVASYVRTHFDNLRSSHRTAARLASSSLRTNRMSRTRFDSCCIRSRRSSRRRRTRRRRRSRRSRRRRRRRQEEEEEDDRDARSQGRKPHRPRS